MSFGCEMNAKSSTLAAMLPLAEQSGHCEIRPLSTVFRIETDSAGRVSEVIYRDVNGREQGQRARAVIVAANGAETPRLLLLSESSRYPDGLANGSGLVGRYLMANAHSALHAQFEHELNEFKSVQCTRIVHDFYETDPKRGFYGGGGLDARSYLNGTPIMHSLNGIPPGFDLWGQNLKNFLAETFSHRMVILGSATSLPLESNNVSLDPEIKDEMGRPALRITYRDHDDDLAMAGFLQDRAEEIAIAAGALATWRDPVEHQNVIAHLLGTCRMGNDPAASVVDRYHRSHEVPNLFVCDGSSLVSSGRGQPTMTIQALAFRAAEHIASFARRGEI